MSHRKPYLAAAWHRRRGPDSVAFAWLTVLVAFITAALALASPAAAAAPAVWPREIMLDDLYARQQILVEQDGKDVTREAVYRVDPPASPPSTPPAM